MRNRSILFSAFSILLIFVCIWLIEENGFSNEYGWKLRIFQSKYGIPIQNWMISVIYIIICFGLIIWLVSSIKNIINNTSFNNFMKQVEKIGESEFIENSLKKIPRSTLNKRGDLRYNDKFFFYFKGTDAIIIPTIEIVSIIPVQQNSGHKEYYVQVNTKKSSFKIYAKKEKIVVTCRRHCIKMHEI